MEAAAQAATHAASLKGAIYHTQQVWTVGEALRTPAFWIIAYGTSAFTLVFNMCIAHGVVHMQDRGIDTSLSATAVGLLVMASVFGRLGCGTIGSGVEPRLSWSAGFILMALGLQTLAMVSANWQVYVYAVGIGAGFGVCYVSLATMLGNYFGMAAFAPLLGIITTITCIVGALAPALGGIIYDSRGDYGLAFNLLLAVALLGAVSIPIARPPATPAAP
jgi:MFS family permease